MKKLAIARHLARRSRVSEAEAADQLVRIVHDIVSRIRKGEEPAVPGLGKFRNEPNGRFVFVPEEGRRHG